MGVFIVIFLLLKLLSQIVDNTKTKFYHFNENTYIKL